eukprot:3940835-Rhodomonas_salina.2
MCSGTAGLLSTFRFLRLRRHWRKLHAMATERAKIEAHRSILPRSAIAELWSGEEKIASSLSSSSLHCTSGCH